MKIVLTGASGFLGSHLARRFVDDGHTVVVGVRGSTSLDRVGDFLDRMELVDLDQRGIGGLFEGSPPPHAVVHTATRYGRTEKEASEVYESNVLFPMELVKQAADNKVRNFINTDTFYPRNYGPLYAYASSKGQFSQWGRAQVKNRGGRFINLRLQHLYGPDDREDKFIPFLIESCLKRVPEIPLTEGTQKRDFIYISDAVQAYVEMLENLDVLPEGYLHFDIGTGTSVSVRHLAEKIRAATRSDSVLLFGDLPLQEGELMDSKANTANLREMGWEPLVSLDEGIARTIQYFSGKHRGDGK